MNKKNLELLAPAESLEKLKIATEYGADAVYIGGNKLNLKAFCDGFSNEEILEAIKFCHSKDKKIYITLNVFARNSDIEYVSEYIKKLDDMGIDAIIISDASLLSIAKKIAPNLDIHMDVNANIVNSVSANFWFEQGVKRVVLSRELTLEEISIIGHNIPQKCETEISIHGSICIANSGRSLLSNYMYGKNAENNIISNLDRNKYYLVEQKREGKYYPVIEDSCGTYIMNDKDLCMIEHIPELVCSGASSLKIERIDNDDVNLKDIVKMYREALDLYLRDSEKYEFKQLWADTLQKVMHKEYDTGFYLGRNSGK